MTFRLLNRVARVVVKSMTFSTSKRKSYPLLVSEMILPEDAILTTKDVEKIFRNYFELTCFFDKEDINYHVQLFVDNLEKQLKSLELNLSDSVDVLRHCMKKMNIANSNLLSSKNEKDKEFFYSYVDRIKTDIDDLVLAINNSTAYYENFKKNKRDFLIDYVNTLVHGCGWKEEARQSSRRDALLTTDQGSGYRHHLGITTCDASSDGISVEMPTNKRGQFKRFKNDHNIPLGSEFALGLGD